MNIIDWEGEDEDQAWNMRLSNLDENLDRKISKNSIFLKYLPLPLIKKAHQYWEEDVFIDIYQSDSYEKATLIWNREMKDKLKETILMNSASLMSRLKKFSAKYSQNDKSQ
eukprot:CAMPEP_0202980488 /NCGR_PEP_ID=MMETSP1396-20130829/86409_1 /ASSEMBLY_ACC=CAM_ASM_000872 /TAXON_ID= /ORGANISM="Pseudokeronopsis sp., Strain Brazil" /LENGTH=110 /DNA_ID=CAMNT_0049720505 /DNA_START=763 /DNA_END=1092 /DNA_ORIENTATION=+